MRKIFLLTMVLVASCALALGQTRTVRGVVTSAEDGGTLPQLTVLLKGTTTGVITNMDGVYSIRVPNDQAVLIFKYTGYETQEIPVNGRSEINVMMRPALEEIDQVVVVGYGSAKRVGSTVGKVTTVGETDLKEKPSANVMDALQGKVAGMQMLSSSGEPGQLASIRLHGQGSLSAGTDPLYVVDGMPVSQTTVLSMSQSDVANVSVLTDASATSIYGARAANGVIYITTKQGKRGEKGTVTVRGMYGMSNLASTDYFDQALSSKELFDLRKELGQMTDADIQAIKDKYGENTNEKWYEYIYAKNAPVWSAEVSMSGGSQGTSYYLSGGYYSQQGLRAFSSYERYHLRSNVRTKVNSWLTAGINSNFAYVISNTNGAAPRGSIGRIYNMPPYYTPYDKDGKPYYSTIPGAEVIAPKYEEDHYVVDRGDFRFTTLGFLQVQPIRGLTVRSQGSVEGRYYYGKANNLPSADWNKQDTGPNKGSSNASFERGATFTWTNTAEYRFRFLDDHEITALAGQEFIYGYSNNLTASGSGFIDDRLMNLGGASENKQIGSGSSAYSFNSFFGRLEYNYLNRYFLDGSLRSDWSSRFAKAHRTALFWSVGAMWKAKREAFLQDVEWLDDLSVRANIGTSGNASIGNYASLALIGTYSSPYKGGNALYIKNSGNPDLTWEQQLKTTVGVDFSIFRILRADISFYYRRTSSMLMDVPNPLSSGFSSLSQNVGTLSNMGVDLRLDVNAWSNNQGDYVAPYVTFNYNREQIEELFLGLDSWAPSNTGTVYRKGAPVEFYFPTFYRVNPKTGLAEWYLPKEGGDAGDMQNDTDKVTDVFDMEMLQQRTGYPVVAPYTGGFGLNASYWGFYLQADFIFVLNKWMISNDDFFYLNPVLFAKDNVSKRYLDNVWRKEGDTGKLFPRMDATTQRASEFDTRLLSDASFMRMKNLTIGYMVPKRWIEKTRFFNTAKVYMTLRNYLTVTKYQGPDPEVDSNVGMGTNPNTKQISFGVELTF